MDLIHSTKDGLTKEDFLVKISDDEALVRVVTQWKFSDSVAEAPCSFDSLDLTLRLLPISAHDADAEGLQHIPDASETNLGTFVRGIWTLDSSSFNKTEIVSKVILARQGGYVCRSDVLDVRMQHSQYVEGVISFSAWDNYLLPLPSREVNRLLPLLQSSAGVLIARQSHLHRSENLRLLHQDLFKRLSFDWVLSEKPAARRLAVVGGRPMPDPKSGTFGSAIFFQAAQALGISIIVFDAPGHWLEDGTHAHLREDFVSMDMSDLEELPQALARAIVNRKEKVDGIVTFMDEYVLTTSQAAELLSLPTEPVQSMLKTNFKHEMRRIVRESNIQVVALKDAQQMDEPDRADAIKNLRYPMVVKPCRGLTSKGIKKAVDEISLRQAVRMLDEDEDGLARHGILIETYVDGPEFDANFVLWQGQILFLEVTDNFPCLADASGATLASNFAETVQISNTGLPSEEVGIIRASILRSLLKLGFESGVFHCEGRMMDSSMRYDDVHHDGILDLATTKSVASDREPNVFLLEINVRPPGTGGTWATLNTYGVDLGALQLLRACDDRVRFEALSAPFTYSSDEPGDGGGAQWWTAHCMVPIHRENVRVPEDFLQKLQQALPEIVPYVTRAEMYATPGTVVSPIAGIGWIAYILLGSRKSRVHTLHMYHQIAETSKKLLDANYYDSGYES